MAAQSQAPQPSGVLTGRFPVRHRRTRRRTVRVRPSLSGPIGSSSGWTTLPMPGTLTPGVSCLLLPRQLPWQLAIGDPGRPTSTFGSTTAGRWPCTRSGSAGRPGLLQILRITSQRGSHVRTAEFSSSRTDLRAGTRSFVDEVVHRRQARRSGGGRQPGRRVAGRAGVRRWRSSGQSVAERLVDVDHESVVDVVPGLDHADLRLGLGHPPHHVDLEQQAEAVTAVAAGDRGVALVAEFRRSGCTVSSVCPPISPVCRCRATIRYIRRPVPVRAPRCPASVAGRRSRPRRSVRPWARR